MNRTAKIVAATAVVVAIAAPPAQARSATIGSVAGTEFGPDPVACLSARQTATGPAEPSYVVPFRGTIRSWRSRGMTTRFDGQLRTAKVQLQVHRQTGPSRWVLVGETKERKVPARSLRRFRARIRVRRGDVLGLRSSIGCSYTSRVVADFIETMSYHPAVGSTATAEGGYVASRLNVSATVASCVKKRRSDDVMKPRKHC